MKKIIVLFFGLLLAGCPLQDGIITLNGGADLNVAGLSQCEIRQSGGYYFVRQTGADPFIFSFDWSVVYPDSWVTLTEADALRVSPLSPTEQDVISGL